jgi:hypothetical protein
MIDGESGGGIVKFEANVTHQVEEADLRPGVGVVRALALLLEMGISGFALPSLIITVRASGRKSRAKTHLSLELTKLLVD